MSRTGWRQIFAFTEDPDVNNEINRVFNVKRVFKPYIRGGDAGHWTVKIGRVVIDSGKFDYQPYRYRGTDDINCSLFSLYAVYQHVVPRVPELMAGEYLNNYRKIGMMLDRFWKFSWFTEIMRPWQIWSGWKWSEIYRAWREYTRLWKLKWCH